VAAVKASTKEAKVARPRVRNWTRIGDRIFQVLESIRKREATFKAAAKKRGITLNQLIAAALAGMLHEEIEGPHGT
jgi:hypothetical protein